MRDSWCKPVKAKTGNWVSGGAARNVRIAEAGGMDEILEDAVAVGTRAGVKHALERMAERQAPQVAKRTALRLVTRRAA